MSYATIKDAKDLYGEDYVLTSVDRDANGQPDTTALTKALTQSSSQIDSYLGERYTVPVSPVPDIIKTFSIDIAIYRCSMSFGGGLTDEKRRRYEDAVQWLRDVAAGKAGLGDPNPDPATQNLPETSYSARLFSRSKMSGIL